MTDEPISSVEFTAYRTEHDGASAVDWPLRPAASRREWMDDFPDRWPCQCLPLVMANQAGWEILCPATVRATWTGGAGADALRLEFDEHGDALTPVIASHFGGGIVTFLSPYLFRTSEPVGLFVRGPCNFWVDGAVALDGWVQSFGLEATFTLNWKVTRKGVPVVFERGQPLCLIQPFDAGLLERVRPRAESLAGNPELARRHACWCARRALFGSVRRERQAQGTYTRGVDESGAIVSGHRTRLRLRGFESGADG